MELLFSWILQCFWNVLSNWMIMMLIGHAYLNLINLFFKLIDHDSHEQIHKIAKLSKNCVIMILMNCVITLRDILSNRLIMILMNKFIKLQKLFENCMIMMLMNSVSIQKYSFRWTDHECHAVTRNINICVMHILIMMLIDQASLWFTLKSSWSWISYKIK